jgi:hypothetical protein
MTIMSLYRSVPETYKVQFAGHAQARLAQLVERQAFTKAQISAGAEVPGGRGFESHGGRMSYHTYLHSILLLQGCYLPAVSLRAS